MLYITLRQIEYVVAVARAGSLSAAAAHLNVSQPSVSVALAQVEARLQHKLFLRRKGAPLALTSFAERYVAEAEALLALARRLEDPAQVRAALNSQITLGCFEDLAPHYLARALACLRAALPGVDLRYRVADFETLAREMIEGRIDLSLTYDLGLDASFARHQVTMAVPHAFIAAQSPLAGDAPIPLADLAQQPLILFDEGLSIRHVLRLFTGIGMVPVVRHRVKSLEVMRSLAASGEGVGIAYTVPPGGLSYGGQAVRARPIADRAAREPVILAHGASLPVTEVLEQARAALIAGLPGGEAQAQASGAVR